MVVWSAWRGSLKSGPAAPPPPLSSSTAAAESSAQAVALTL